jgi:hypothetical protein
MGAELWPCWRLLLLYSVSAGAYSWNKNVTYPLEHDAIGLTSCEVVKDTVKLVSDTQELPSQIQAQTST